MKRRRKSNFSDLKPGTTVEYTSDEGIHRYATIASELKVSPYYSEEQRGIRRYYAQGKDFSDYILPQQIACVASAPPEIHLFEEVAFVTCDTTGELNYGEVLWAEGNSVWLVLDDCSIEEIPYMAIVGIVSDASLAVAA